MYDDVDLFDRYQFRRHDIMDLVDLVDDNIEISNRKGSLTTTLQVLVALRFFACGSFQLVVGRRGAREEGADGRREEGADVRRGGEAHGRKGRTGGERKGRT